MLITKRRVLTLLSASALTACAAQVDPEEAALTPAETEGPFYPENTNAERDVDLTRLAGRSERAAGQLIEMRGRVLGPTGQPISGARVELWQANAGGRYAHSRDAGNPAPLDPNFQGYAVVQSGPDGRFSFTTIKPGGYLVASEGPRTPHMHWKIATGAHTLTTQSYFAGEAANDTDFLIRAMRPSDVPRMIAAAGPAGADGALGFDWDVIVQA